MGRGSGNENLSAKILEKNGLFKSFPLKTKRKKKKKDIYQQRGAPGQKRGTQDPHLLQAPTGKGPSSAEHVFTGSQAELCLHWGSGAPWHPAAPCPTNPGPSVACSPLSIGPFGGGRNLGGLQRSRVPALVTVSAFSKKTGCLGRGAPITSGTGEGQPCRKGSGWPRTSSPGTIPELGSKFGEPEGTGDRR